MDTGTKRATTDTDARVTGENVDDEQVGRPMQSGGSGGLGTPNHAIEDASRPLDETLSEGARGVDVSGTSSGAGNTRMTITPSLSNPNKTRK